MDNVIVLIILFYSIFINNAVSIMEEDLNPEYILRPDLMPTSLLVLDSDTESSWINNTKVKPDPNNVRKPLSFNGSWSDAYTTMGFHRKMLNEYLCRNFVSDAILSQIQTPLISKRSGRPFSKINDKDKQTLDPRKSRSEAMDVKDNLLSDPGSSSYRDWLSKTTTLDDVYRHYDMTVSRASVGDEDNEEAADYDGGDFTGYAMPNTKNMAGKNDYTHPPMSGPSYGPPNFGPPSYVPHSSQMMEPDKFGGGGYDYAPHHVVHFHSDSEKSNHGLALNDVFDIALTALAFLSFGMFILQVIMCITSNKPMVTMMQMTEPDMETDQVEEIRFKRDTIKATGHLNELSRRVLNSIEAGIEAEHDDGTCLRWSLCDNNRYSRSLQDKQKIWIPVWGLGMSWLSSRFMKNSPTSSAMLESLRACALGLARADCENIYADCNLRHLLTNRKTKRSK